MKRKLSILLLSALIMGIFAGSAFAATTEKRAVRFDFVGTAVPTFHKYDGDNVDQNPLTALNLSLDVTYEFHLQVKSNDSSQNNLYLEGNKVDWSGTTENFVGTKNGTIDKNGVITITPTKPGTSYKFTLKAAHGKAKRTASLTGLSVTGYNTYIAASNKDAVDLGTSGTDGTSKEKAYALSYFGKEATTPNFIWGGQKIAKPGNDKWDQAEAFAFVISGSQRELKVTGTISPASSGLTFKQDSMKKYGAVSGEIKAWLEGTVPTPGKDQDYIVKIDASSIAGKKTTYYKFTVKERPSIKQDYAKDVKFDTTYGESNPILKVDSKTALENLTWELSNEELKGYTTKDELKKYGIEFDATKKLFTGTWASPDYDAISFDKNSKASLKVKLILSRDITTGSLHTRVQDSKDVTLTFVAAKPNMETGADVAWTKAMNVGEELDNDKKYVIVANGPGKIRWTVDTAKLPKGLSFSVVPGTDSGDTWTQQKKSYLVFSGAPEEVLKDTKIKITASNAAGSVSVQPTFHVGLTEANFVWGDASTFNTTDNTLTGAWVVGDTIDSAGVDIENDAIPQADAVRKVFQVNAGPTKWTATNLPKGITLKQSDDRTAYLTGKFTKATAKAVVDDADVAKITVTNKDDTSLTKTVKFKYAVFEKPSITTKKIFDNNVIKVGSEYTGEKAVEFEAKGNNTAKATTWEINIGGIGSGDKYEIDGDDSNGLEPSESEATAGTISGKLGRVPDGGKLVITVAATNPAGTDVKTYTVKVEGSEPAFDESTITEFTTNDPKTSGTREIKFSTGTLPIETRAYIDQKTAKKVFGIDKEIDLSKEFGDDNPTGFVYEAEDDVNDTDKKLGTLSYLGEEANKAYDKLKITIEATNEMTTKKPKTATILATITGVTPSFSIVESDDDTVKELEANGTTEIDAIAGSVVGYYDDEPALNGNPELVIQVIGTAPITLTYPKTAQNGLTMAERDSDTDGVYKELVVTGTPTAGKSTKTKFKIEAKNPQGNKVKYTLQVNGLMPPVLSSTAKDLKKEIIMGDAISLAPKAKGDGTITWRLDEAEDGAFDADSTNEITDTLKTSYNITFTSGDGKFVAEKSETTKPTLDEAEEKYETKKYYLKARNASGQSKPVLVEIGIQGLKPTLTTSTITFNRGSTYDLASDAYLLKSDISGQDGTDVKYEAASDKDLAALDAMGLSIQDTDYQENGTAQFEVSDLVATKAKGTAVNLILNNYQTKNKGKVTIIVNDPKPVLEGDDFDTIDATDKKLTEEVTVALDEATAGTSKLKWEITKDGKLTVKGLSAAIKADKDAQSATITLTVNAKFNPNKNNSVVDDKFTIRVTNPETKEYTDKTYNVRVNPYVEDTSASPEDEADADTEADVDETEADGEDEEELARGEGDVILGEARTEAALTAGERAAIAAEGYMIAAVLPEVTVTEDGLYDLDVAELVEEAPEGAELVWFAFPRNAAASEDDEIAEFYDEAGAEIEVVPAERKVVPAAWFNAEVTYAPVIAVKVPATEETKDTAEDAEAGDVVTLEALEAAE